MTRCLLLGDIVIGVVIFKDRVLTECQLLGDIV